MLFVKHEYPKVYEQTRVFLPRKDYLSLRHTGEIAASYDSMVDDIPGSCRASRPTDPTPPIAASTTPSSASIKPTNRSTGD